MVPKSLAIRSFLRCFEIDLQKILVLWTAACSQQGFQLLQFLQDRLKSAILPENRLRKSFVKCSSSGFDSQLSLRVTSTAKTCRQQFPQKQKNETVGQLGSQRWFIVQFYNLLLENDTLEISETRGWVEISSKLDVIKDFRSIPGDCRWNPPIQLVGPAQCR